jgi:hypothetical protein
MNNLIAILSVFQALYDGRIRIGKYDVDTLNFRMSLTTEN